MRKTAVAVFIQALLLSVVLSVVAFADTIALPLALSDLGEAAFQDDLSLDSVVINEGVKEIKDLTFAGSSLREIYLPSTINFIADNAFDPNSGVQFFVLNQYSYDWAVAHGFAVTMDKLPIQLGETVSLGSYTTCDLKFEALTTEFYVITSEGGIEDLSAVLANGESYSNTDPSNSLVFYAPEGAVVYISAHTSDRSGSITLWRTSFEFTGGRSLSLNQNYSVNSGGLMRFTPNAAGTYYFSYIDASVNGRFQILDQQTGVWHNSESSKYQTDLNAEETIYIRANYNTQNGTQQIIVSDEAFNNVEIKSFSVTNKGASFVLTVNTRQTTADTGYRLGIQFAMSASEVGTQAYGAVNRNTPEIRHKQMSNGEVQLSIDFAPGYEGYVRARMSEPQSGRTLAVGEIQAIQIPGGLDGFEELQIGSALNWSNSGKRYFYFESPEAGNYLLRGTNMNELRAMDKDCIARGANGDVPNYTFGMSLAEGDILYIFASNPDGKDCSVSMNEEQIIRTDTLSINGKDYTAPYYGTQDFSDPALPFRSAEFWHLENAYSDFAEYPRTGDLALPDADYPMYIETNQVYVVDFTFRDGNIYRKIMRCDSGVTYNGMRMTQEINLNGPHQENKIISGTTYVASYYGSQDIASWSDRYTSREFWRIENAYSDFQSSPTTGEYLPASNYPMPIEPGQIFIIDYTLKSGGTERMVMRCDGEYWNGQLNTRRIIVYAPLSTGSKTLDNGSTYPATCYGWEYIGNWHPNAVACEFWHLEGAYDDFRDCPLTGNYSSAVNYPMPVENGQVYFIHYIQENGASYDQLMRCDGEFSGRVPGELNTVEFLLD